MLWPNSTLWHALMNWSMHSSLCRICTLTTMIEWQAILVITKCVIKCNSRGIRYKAIPDGTQDSSRYLPSCFIEEWSSGGCIQKRPKSLKDFFNKRCNDIGWTNV